MKRTLAMLLAAMMVLSLSACGADSTTELPHDNDPSIDSTSNSSNTPIAIKESPNKYTWYIKDYVGKNCASLGYASLGGDRLDPYGAGLVELIFVSADGSYIDIESDDVLKEYSVTGQNLAPNTELKLVFDKDSEGNEYDNLVASQSFEEIVLSVKKVGDTQQNMVNLISITPSPDRYTWYIADYVGRNLASCGYTSIGGDLMARYGAAVVKFIIVAEDGAYIDPSDTESLKNYVVTDQNVAPNTELKLVFDKDSEGNEYDNLVESQNIEEMELHVKQISNE